jgi:hypothetical protein
MFYRHDKRRFFFTLSRAFLLISATLGVIVRLEFISIDLFLLLMNSAVALAFPTISKTLSVCSDWGLSLSLPLESLQHTFSLF